MVLKRAVLFSFFVLFITVSNCFSVNAQYHKTVVDTCGTYKKVYNVYKDDVNIKDGDYFLYYKDKVIEKGCYKDNEKVGNWRFYNLNRTLEYEYDFDNKEIVSISGRDNNLFKHETPCLYVGSPLIPYLFFVENLSYPAKAVNQDLQGDIVLALKIDKQGKIYGFYLYKKLQHIIDKAVKDVAIKMPYEWDFLPATYQGKPVMSEYHISIEFELVP